MTMTKPVTMTTMTMLMMTVNDNESKKMRDPFRREIDFPLSFPFSVCLCKRFLILCIAKENFPKVRVFFQTFNILLSGLWGLQYHGRIKSRTLRPDNNAEWLEKTLSFLGKVAHNASPPHRRIMEST